MTAEFGAAIRGEFPLDPSHTYLNHGSYGAAPKKVREARLRLLTEMETYPDTWFRETAAKHWDDNIQAAAKFLQGNPDNLSLVQNTTAGCEVVTASIKLPIHSKDDVIELYRETLAQHPSIKVAVLELICSPTATLLPVQELAALCKQHGVTVVVDGAHGPGHVPLDLEALGAAGVDCFIGNLHKWVFAPMGCAILWIHPRLHGTVRPAVTSHIMDSKTPGPCFRVQGTRDDTPMYTAKSAISFYEEIGGMEAIIQYNKQLMDDAVAMLVEEWNASKFPIPADMEAPCMRMITMPYVSSLAPDAAELKEVFGDAQKWMAVFRERFNITTVVIAVHGVVYIRLCTNIYNTLDDYRTLAKAVETLMQEADKKTED